MPDDNKDRPMTPDFEEWLATRPECVQELAKIFRPMDMVIFGGAVYYVIGYTEDDMLIVSKTNPAEDYEKALVDREFFCVKHLKTLEGGG